VQICADIFDRPFTRSLVAEAGCLGAAVLAGAGSGVFRSLEEGVDAMVSPGDPVEPRAGAAARYEERYARYRKLWPLLGDYLRGW